MATPDYPDPLPIPPFRHPVDGVVVLPGSKSITNRALALAALSKASLQLEGALFSDDTRVMVTALKQLGFKVSEDETGRSLFIMGGAGNIPNAEAELYVGNAGTASRILTALLCLKPGGRYQLDGTPAMRKRPMRGLLDALTAHGACKVTYHGEVGHFPFTLETFGLRGGELTVDASASSQILTALLIIAPLASEPLTVTLAGETVSRPFIDMTLAMQSQFGITADATGTSGRYRYAPNQVYHHAKAAYVIEPDATAASYLLSLPWVVGGQLSLSHCQQITLQGDIAFADLLRQLGATLTQSESHLVIQYPERRTPGLDEDFNAISDTFLTLAALTPLLTGPTTIRGIAHTRKQETDRIHAMATELRRLGQHVTETEGTMTVTPDLAALKDLTRNNPLTVSTYDDHRVAMSFGVLGCHDLHGDGRTWLNIADPGCCAKTFPNFFRLVDQLRRP